MYVRSDTYTRDDTFWESYDGRQILIKDLKVRHLVNILNWIRIKNGEGAGPKYSVGLCQLLEAEAELRTMVGWAKNKGIPRKLDDGKWVVINQTHIEKAVEDIKSLYHRYKLHLKFDKS